MFPKEAAEVLEKYTKVTCSLLGIDVISSEEVAIKVESIKNNAGLLEHEAKIYKALAGGGTLY